METNNAKGGNGEHSPSFCASGFQLTVDAASTELSVLNDRWVEAYMVIWGMRPWN